MKQLLIFLTATVLLFANEDLDFENDFLSSLDEVSEIATKTKLNIDDTPSFITVLHSSKLQELGINNVYEALAQVPGVQLKREASGVPVVIFRGVSQKGEVKLMVDGVTINNSYRGSIYHYLDFPIELIERIEVIRGAGSVLYGSGAISGVVNIITKNANNNNEDSVFISGGTYDYYKAGTHFSTKIDDIQVAFDAYYQNSSKTIDSTDRHLRDFSVGVNIKNENFGLIARIKESNIGNAYGILDVPDLDTKKYDNINGAIFAQLSYHDKLSKESEIEILAGYSKYGQIVAAQYSAGTLDAKYHEHSYYAQIDLKSTILQNNTFLLGSKYESSEVTQSEVKMGSTLRPPVANPDSKRDILSLYANDIYSISSDLDISAGLRYDNYSDFDDAFSPTLGLVYRLTPTIRVKTLYAQAFRAPSWVEITKANSNLKAETSGSIEAGIIYKNDQDTTLRFNIYTTRINDMIVKNASRIYVQNEGGNFTGSEIEYIYMPNNKLELNVFGSYIHAVDSDNNDLADVANILATTSLIYKLDNGLSFGSLLKYVSSSKRSQTGTPDSRDDMPSSLIFDETISYSFENFSANLIIKDLFDKGTYYALPVRGAYNNDFNDGGRSVLLKATWEF